MILLFGGTTEGRMAIKVLEEAGQPFFYSTLTAPTHRAPDPIPHRGLDPLPHRGLDPLPHRGLDPRSLHGPMDATAMTDFCRQNDIRLLIDAGHPFASQLHQTVAAVAQTLSLPAIRYERIFPPRADDIVWLNDYDEAVGRIRCHSLLATTGVKSIGRLKALEQHGVRVTYRILPRESSIRMAHEQGATDDQLCYYEDSTAIDTDAEAILMKESGLSGGFVQKVEAARAKGMTIYAIRRPATPKVFHRVDGPHGLRRAVEQLLPAFFTLKSGLTTGTCATAAAIAATRRLLRQETPKEVDVVLPDGETISVDVGYADGYAYCIKQAGDDPDVTNGLEIRASAEPSEGLEICGGDGVGRFTLPGFDFPPGEAAINKGPREMIHHNIKENVRITISVPQGAEIAKRTFNPRLGIEGGISIIGVSGIVKPFSEEAFVDSIRKCMQVAKASGTQHVVLNSGAKSERFLKARYAELPQQAFVQYGNYIGQTLSMADELLFADVTLGMMLGKAVKLAEGQLDTHSKKGTMNTDFIRQMLAEAHIRQPAADSPWTLARELWERIPEEKVDDFCRVVIGHCLQHCRPLVPHCRLTLLLIADDGTIHSL